MISAPASRDRHSLLSPETNGLSDAQIATFFESLGDNCEFGFYQRGLGVEQLGLLRWAGISLRSLITAVSKKFLVSYPALDAHISVEGNTHEYMLKIPALGWSGHTFTHEGTADKDEVLKKHLKFFKFLSQKLIDQIESADRIFVFRQNGPMIDNSIYVLHDIISWYGTNTLLWVVEAEHDYMPGDVHWVRRGLMKGHTRRLSLAANGTLVSHESWSAICRNALTLWKLEAPNRIKETVFKERSLIKEIIFQKNENPHAYLRGGFSGPERKYTWIDSDIATLELDPPPLADGYVLTIEMAPFRPNNVLKQPVNICVNGHTLKR
jgi:hypothetical protein